jgi:hypothetical protein
MKTWTVLQPLTLSAALLATLTLAAPASAQEPTIPSAATRVLMRAADGEYTLEDGRTLKVHVAANHLDVGLGASPLETWKADGNGLLVSPDGMRRVRLYRNVDGSVDRIAYEAVRVVR